mgnify:FL=1
MPTLRPWTYLYRGMVVDSASVEGCPLPTRSCVTRDLGCVENLVPLVWSSLLAGKVRLQVQHEICQLPPSDVELLAAGVIYWGMDELKERGGYDFKYDRVPNMYLDLPELPETEDAYFDDFLRVSPTADHPHPEEDLLGSAIQKWTTEQVESMTLQEKMVWQYPPATSRQAWYGVVRIGLKAGSVTARRCKNHMPVVCKVQALDAAAGLGTVTAWGLRMAKYSFSDEVNKALQRLELKPSDQGTLRVMPDGDDTFCTPSK